MTSYELDAIVKLLFMCDVIISGMMTQIRFIFTLLDFSCWPEHDIQDRLSLLLIIRHPRYRINNYFFDRLTSAVANN
jgi:hypothetical protein